ncbi:cytochrome c3 family protein [Thermosulfurimonas sp. F29]|uniref:cytochrome c3 family protein n=1 Tax=Thermosulfurimonas sp. F29 TaxID=2867247 RepID=UPI001C83C7BD|nr:cytochrome c3 family protein [Thermosulfurimonas sp. F29]MBX6424237.1 cytochrome c family protein [Thermosulfurimonas sp. F29]
MKGIRSRFIAVGVVLALVGLVGATRALEALDVPRIVVMKSEAGRVRFHHLKHAAAMGCDRCHHAGRGVSLVRLLESEEDKRHLSRYFRCRECHYRDPERVRRGCLKCHRERWKEIWKRERRRGLDAETAREFAEERVPVTCTGCHRGARAQARLLMEVLP